MPNTITNEEEIHRDDEIQINTLELTKDEKGLYSFDFPCVDGDGAYVIYRIPYMTGDILFCIMS